MININIEFSFNETKTNNTDLINVLQEYGITKDQTEEYISINNHITDKKQMMKECLQLHVNRSKTNTS